MQEKAPATLPDIRYTYLINAPVEKVWRAVATAEGLSAWLMPTGDFQPVLGQAFTFRTEPDGDFDGIIHSKVLELDPPHRLGFTWDSNNMVKGQYITFELKEAGAKTEFLLVHSGWVAGLERIHALLDGGWGSREEIISRIEQFIGV